MLPSASPRLLLCYFWWQEPDMAQWAQLQPQLDFPFFLSFTSFRMMSTTTTVSYTHLTLPTT